MAKRQSMYGKNNYTPEDPIDNLKAGTFYLTKVDKQY